MVSTILLLLLVNVYSVVKLGAAESGVTKQLQDVYAIEGSMAVFLCSGYSPDSLFGIRIDGKIFLCSDESTILEGGVTCHFSENGLININRVVTLNITVPAIAANNATAVLCYFHDINGDYFQTAATLFVVSDPPLPPGTPSVTIINLTMLNISWTAPWYPTDSYILRIKNMTAEGGETISCLVNTTSLIKTQEYSNGLCHSLEFSVLAISQFGNSDQSSATISGFPIELSPIDESSIEVDQWQHTDKSITISIVFLPPKSCLYQTVEYSYTLSSSLNDSKHTYGPTSQTQYEIGDLPPEFHYLLTIAVWDETGLMHNTNMTIFSMFGISDASKPPSTSSPTVTDQFVGVAETDTVPQGTDPIALLIGIVASIGGAILLMVCISIGLLTVFLLRTHKRLLGNETARSLSADKNIQTPLPSAHCLPMNSVNRTFESFDAVYDCIPEQEPLPQQVLQENGGLQTESQHILDDDVNTGENVTSLFSPTVKQGFEEYVEMSSTSRYVKSPLAFERKMK